MLEEVDPALLCCGVVADVWKVARPPGREAPKNVNKNRDKSGAPPVKCPGHPGDLHEDDVIGAARFLYRAEPN
uniref:Uncharacterized protein n=1 Tax=Rhynchophorus ferrugineus TaxID=354439 RepID=A0A834HZ73_RHYFE|nr:hypothetical protein GWI33_000642 [Rhynchophorus ferrugineus]